MEPRPDCVVLGAVDVGHGGEGVVVLGHGDGLVRPVAGYRVDCSLSDSGLPVGAAAASMADSQQTAGATWNWLAAVQRLDCRLHLFPCWEKVTLGPRGWIEEVPDSIRNQDRFPPQEYLHR